MRAEEVVQRTMFTIFYCSMHPHSEERPKCCVGSIYRSECHLRRTVYFIIQSVFQVSSMPVPPLNYVKLYTDENVKAGRAPR